MKTLVVGVGGALVGASQSPAVSLDLTPIIVAILALLGALVAAGWLTTRRQKRLQDAQVVESRSTAKLNDATAVMSHAQYEGFIAEAAQRLQGMSEAAISRLEAELARAQTRIAELETELEKVKAKREITVAAAAARENELKAEMGVLRDKVTDLERRLEAQGAPLRRHKDDPAAKRRTARDDDPPKQE